MIKVQLRGRLGNQMFQYAVCRTIAEKNGYKFYIPKIGDNMVSDSTEGHHISNFFNVDLGELDGDIIYFFNEDHTSQIFNPNILSLPDFTLISGFFQTDKYFKENEEKVKKWFSLDIDSETVKILQKYDIDNYCYIHIRGTDYKNHSHWMLPDRYYIDAINLIKSKYKLKFIIVTDDVEMSKKILPDIECISNDMMVDFKLIYFSKYVIISNSTFAWWGAWLKNKEIVIAPNNWINYNKPELGFYPLDIKCDKFVYV